MPSRRHSHPKLVKAALDYFVSSGKYRPKCYDGKVTVVVPSWDSDRDLRGCPGSFAPCPISERLTPAAQARACETGAGRVRHLMARTFGEGNTEVSAHGQWTNKLTGETFREKNIQITTRFRGSCLTKAKADTFVRELDHTMKGLCQQAFYYEHNNDAVYAFTGHRRRSR